MHLIEFADLAWCPKGIREGVADYCRFLVELSRFFNPVAPLLVDALRQTGARRIVDLGSGAAGPWISLQTRLRELGADVSICLTDCYPDIEAFQRASLVSNGAISYHSEPVDATHVPDQLAGFRTMFQAFHHLRPAQARTLLADAVAKGVGVGVFESGSRSALAILETLGTPLRILFLAPFIQPFRWSRLFWTYLVPALPLVLLFDVVVSCLRIYSPAELHELTSDLHKYHWDIGTVRGKWMPSPITYLIGVPIQKAAESCTEIDPGGTAALKSL